VMAAGVPSSRLDLDAFLVQASEYQEWDSRWDRILRVLAERRGTHPYAVRRVQQLMEWVRGGDYDRILGGQYPRRGESDLRGDTDKASEYYVNKMWNVYRDASESGPAATGWAAEREGDGDVNEVACLENTETSAVGRALANLGFTASRLRPSAEEMAKAARARARIGRQKLAVKEPAVSASHAMYLGDLLNLVAAAERLGLRPSRAARWRQHLHNTPYEDRVLVQLERRLRDWIVRHQTHLVR